MRLQLIPQASFLQKGNDWVITAPHVQLWISPDFVEMVCQLKSGIEEDRLNESEQYYLVELLNKHALLSYSVLHQGCPMATLYPPFSKNDEERSVWELSQFCWYRLQDGLHILETPFCGAKMAIESDAMFALLRRLATASTVQSLSAGLPFLSKATLEECIQLLHDARAFHQGEEGELAQWEFHDMLFHTRSRMGRHQYPYGGTYPYKGKIVPLGAFKEGMEGKHIPLDRADPTYDPPFFEVLENRRSNRTHGQLPIHVKELGEFLYRSSRVKQFDANGAQQTTQRPYPNGGALYELELYLVVQQCGGIEQGLYYYNPQAHSLLLIRPLCEEVNKLLEDAQYSTGMQAPPQILIVFTSRFQRRSWKYQSISYATTLKNVGVLMQTMYLAATAMNLSPCAVGGGNSDTMAKLINSKYFEETSVGEFILGK